MAVLTQGRRARPPKPNLTRRALLAGGAALVGALPIPSGVAQSLRGSLGATFDASDAGLRPGSPDDQSAAFTAALQRAESESLPLFLPPGRYLVSGVTLPRHAHIAGIPGRTQLVFGGGAFMLRADHADTLRLEGLTFDGGVRPLDPSVPALLAASDVREAVIEDCLFRGSTAGGAFLGGSAGRVGTSRFETLGTIGLHLRESRGVTASGNVVMDCGDTGILVSRGAEGEDGTIVSGNRVSNIRADSGGTGQNGNGINLDKANGVIVSGNRVDGCAFSAIRCFSSDSVAVTDNIATNSGEMALYVEFASEGAIVSNNLIDGGNGGISFANFMEFGGRLATCSGNIVRNIRGGPRYADGNAQIGAGISAEADITISGNVIENAVWGLKLGWGPYLRDVTASANVIRRTKIGIAVSVADGAGGAVIANNIVSGAETGAILGMRWEEIATEELFDGRAPSPLLTIIGNKVD